MTERTEARKLFLLAEFMAAASKSTGGQYLHDTNDWAGSLGAVVAVPEVSYVLGFSPPGDPDGKYHLLKTRYPRQPWIPRGIATGLLCRGGHQQARDRAAAHRPCRNVWRRHQGFPGHSAGAGRPGWGASDTACDDRIGLRCSAACSRTPTLATASTDFRTVSRKSSQKLANSRNPDPRQRLAG